VASEGDGPLLEGTIYREPMVLDLNQETGDRGGTNQPRKRMGKGKEIDGPEHRTTRSLFDTPRSEGMSRRATVHDRARVLHVSSYKSGVHDQRKEGSSDAP
jgi:hypothetical protein